MQDVVMFDNLLKRLKIAVTFVYKYKIFKKQPLPLLLLCFNKYYLIVQIFFPSFPFSSKKVFIKRVVIPVCRIWYKMTSKCFLNKIKYIWNLFCGKLAQWGFLGNYT